MIGADSPEAPLPDPLEFLPPASGRVAGARHTVTRTVGDLALNLGVRRSARALDALADEAPRRRVLVLSAYRPDSTQIGHALEELARSRHELRFALGSTGEAPQELAARTVAEGLSGGKFQNLNAILRAAGGRPQEDADWTLVVDDDIALPRRFLDRFLALCERFGLALAQPAQTLRSHAAWPVTRRRRGSLLRETRFVEVGPLTAFSRQAAAELMPFPELRFGWALDSHWSAIAQERGWRLGVADAVPVRHERRPVASAYRHADAVAEARRFLASREYLPFAAANRTVATHRRLP